MAKDFQSNTEFVTELMEFARCGPIMQIFILDALDKHSKRFAHMTPEELQKAWGAFGFVSPDAWIAAARELQQAIGNRAGSA